MENVKVISLSRGYFTIVDAEDYSELSQYKWHHVKGYAVRSEVYQINGQTKRRTIRMHRAILKPGDDWQVDHINRNKLDNRKSNLRLCTTQENTRNVGPIKNTTSIYKGVYWSKKAGKWIAQIHHNYKKKRIGTFECEHEAAEAYNKAAKEIHGDFAYINEIKRPSAKGR